MKFFKSAFEINWPLGTAVLKGWDFGSAFGILLHYLQAGGIKDKGIQLHKYVSSGDLLQSNNWKREVRWQNKKCFDLWIRIPQACDLHRARFFH